MTFKAANILLLIAESARHTGTVDLHIQAFRQYSHHNIITLDSHVAGQLDFDLSWFDVIVFHYSIVISLPQYISKEFSQRISLFQGPKILFLQDEFRWVDRTSETARKLGVSVVFTVVNKEVIRKIYRDSYFDSVRFEQTLTGFVPEELIKRSVPNYRDRRLDIGYRARKLPGWCGFFALQKWKIGETFLELAKKYKLKCDIAMSEASRIYGEDWIDFMSNCRATLGTESGSSFVDYTGLVHQQIDEYEASHPEAGFEDIRDLFLEGRDGEVIIHVISPRVFEAAALRVLMIMYPGTYSGVVEPGRHYVELLSDHSNIKEVIAVLRDPDKAGKIIDNAYNEVACSPKWTHSAFIGEFDRVANQELKKNTKSIESIDHKVGVDIFSAMRPVESAYATGVRSAKRRMKLVLLIQKIRVKTSHTVEKLFPSVISRPLLFLGSNVSRKVKPILKKILLN